MFHLYFCQEQKQLYKLSRCLVGNYHEYSQLCSFPTYATNRQYQSFNITASSRYLNALHFLMSGCYWSKMIHMSCQKLKHSKDFFHCKYNAKYLNLLTNRSCSKQLFQSQERGIKNAFFLQNSSYK